MSIERHEGNYPYNIVRAELIQMQNELGYLEGQLHFYSQQFESIIDPETGEALFDISHKPTVLSELEVKISALKLQIDDERSKQDAVELDDTDLEDF